MKKRCIIMSLAAVCLLLSLNAGVFNKGAYEKLDGSRITACPFPGEFERQQAVWLQWPSEVYDSGDRPVYTVFINIVKALAPHIKVNLMAQSQEQIGRIRNLINTDGFSGANVNYCIINHFSIWARDVGSIFVRNRQGGLNVVDFGFNNYGRGGSQYYIDVESQVDRQVAGLLGLPVISSGLVSEGGAIESNGRGTLMTTESVALSRNPGLTKTEIENEYKRVLGVSKIIWLKHGLAEDDRITGGHINEIARFADTNTILLAQVLPGDRYAGRASRSTYLRLEENYNILKNSTDQDGKPFNIIRIPMPPTIYGEEDISGRTPVRSYLNYAVTNGAVLVQTYWRPGRSETLKKTEDQVRGIFESAFPGRQIISIDAENINLWGGGIHCVTQHMPVA